MYSSLFPVLLLALIYRLVIILSTNLTFFSDDAIYAALARNLVNLDINHFFHPTWFPFFPLISAFVFLLLQNWELSLRIVSMLSGVLFLIPLYIITEKTLGKLEAVLFTLAFTFFTPVISLSIFPLSDTLSALLTVSSLISTFFATHSQKSKTYLLAAFLFGLSYLTRPEGSMLFFLTLIYLSFMSVIKYILKVDAFKKILIVPVMATIFFLTISPYLIAVRLQLGEWTMSAKFSAQIQQGHAFALINNTTWAQEVTSINDPNYASAYFRNGFGYLLDHEFYLRHWFIEKLPKWELLFYRNFPKWSVVFIALGLLGIFRSKYLISFLYFLFVLSISIPLTIFSTAVAEIRYLLWTMPFFYLFFYLGFNTISKFLRRLKILNVSPGLYLITLTPFFLTLLFPAINIRTIFNPLSELSTSFTKTHYRPQFKELADFIRTNNPDKKTKIMMKHEMVEFYSGSETIYLPATSFRNLLKYAKEQQADYLVIWEEEVRLDNNLASLANPDIPHPGLKLVYRSKTPEGNLLLYSLLDDPRVI